MNIFDLNGQKAIVTGATRGLGHGMAEALLEAGAECVIIATSEKIYGVAEAFNQRGYKSHGLVCDLANRKERAECFAKAVEILGGLDILVNAAGIQKRYASPDFPLEDWDKVIEVNLTAPFDLSQMAAREFLKKEKPYGKVINIASMCSFFGGLTIPAYSASKGGVAQFTKCMGNELISKGINLNCIAPGYMATEMNTALLDKENPRNAQISDRIPAHRWGTPDDMKGTVVFLASHASDYLSGAIIPVDGGYLVN